MTNLTLHLIDIEGKTALLLHAFSGMKEKYEAPAASDFVAFQTALSKVREHLRILRIESQEADKAEGRI
jgi:hypothetical protein